MPVLIDYFMWHYGRALKEAFHIWRNFVWFDIRLFSIPQLLRSLFAPYRRMTEERTKKWNIEEFLSALTINIISRILGAILRLIFIIIGLFILIFLLAGIIVFYALWLAAPALVSFSLSYGMFFFFL